LKINKREYDRKVTEYFEQKKMPELITRNFYWPNIEEWINEYVRTCDNCPRMKSPRHTKFRLLQPLEVLYSPWESTSVDFIVALCESEGHTQIMVGVDRFLKMGHYIALTETATTRDATRAFVKDLWKTSGIT
jgi:hypothetical protein